MHETRDLNELRLSADRRATFYPLDGRLLPVFAGWLVRAGRPSGIWLAISVVPPIFRYLMDVAAEARARVRRPHHPGSPSTSTDRNAWTLFPVRWRFAGCRRYVVLTWPSFGDTDSCVGLGVIADASRRRWPCWRSRTRRSQSINPRRDRPIIRELRWTYLVCTGDWSAVLCRAPIDLHGCRRDRRSCSVLPAVLRGHGAVTRAKKLSRSRRHSGCDRARSVEKVANLERRREPASSITPTGSSVAAIATAALAHIDKFIDRDPDPATPGRGSSSRCCAGKKAIPRLFFASATSATCCARRRPSARSSSSCAAV